MAQTALIERIYDAVLEADGWMSLVDDFMKAFHGSQAALLSQDNRSGVAQVCAHTVGVSQKALRDYETYYGPRSPLFHYFKSVPLCVPYTDTDYPDQEAYQRSEIYNDLYRPLDAEHLLGVDLIRRTGTSTYLIIRRGARKGHFSDAESRRFADLSRHLQRALRLSRLLEDASQTANALEGVLATQPAAILLTDTAGRIFFLNPRAEELLRGGDGLRLRMGRLQCGRPADTNALHDLIITASNGRDADRGSLLAVSRASSAEPLVVEVLPLPSGLCARRLVMLRVADPQARVPHAKGVAVRFGLTPAEAAVTVALCRGASVADYAVETGISLHTARTLLRSAMAKTDTHRQAELVSRVLTAS